MDWRRKKNKEIKHCAKIEPVYVKFQAYIQQLENLQAK
jgi:hypothetical protein